MQVIRNTPFKFGWDLIFYEGADGTWKRIGKGHDFNGKRHLVNGWIYPTTCDIVARWEQVSQDAALGVVLRLDKAVHQVPQASTSTETDNQEISESENLEA